MYVGMGKAYKWMSLAHQQELSVVVMNLQQLKRPEGLHD